jgi:pyridoxal phosphate enzyme (YggS family)
MNGPIATRPGAQPIPDPADAADPADIAGNLAAVRERVVRAGGDPGRVTIVAVTKSVDADAARAAVGAGLVDLGENYAQDLLAKAAVLDADSTTDSGSLGGPSPVRPVWHFLGRLQTNKVRHLAPHVSLWQSVDRLGVVEEIARRAAGASVLIQLNLSGEAHKGGCPVAEAPALVAAAAEAGLVVKGLMGVGPAGDPGLTRSGLERLVRPGFERLVGLADELDLPVRSIGMSADLEVAVAAGATMIRVGRDLFGPRTAGEQT